MQVCNSALFSAALEVSVFLLKYHHFQFSAVLRVTSQCRFVITQVKGFDSVPDRFSVEFACSPGARVSSLLSPHSPKTFLSSSGSECRQPRDSTHDTHTHTYIYIATCSPKIRLAHQKSFQCSRFGHSRPDHQ